MTGSGLRFLWGGIEKETAELRSGRSEIEQESDGPVAPFYDAQQTLLFTAGDPSLHDDADGNLLADTWLFDGAVWQQVYPLHSPPPLSEGAMAFDPNDGNVVLLGGLSYTVGLGFYLWDSLPYNHAIWHGFVLGGSAFHFAAVLGFVVPA